MANVDGIKSQFKRTRPLALAMLMLLIGGCASSGFSGEWLEDQAAATTQPSADAASAMPSATRRMALKFQAPSTVWYGPYNDQIGVVDQQGVQYDSYFLYDGWDRAQFGSMKAKVEGDHMVATVDGDTERHFTRLHGRDIFPPQVQLPELP